MSFQARIVFEMLCCHSDEETHPLLMGWGRTGEGLRRLDFLIIQSFIIPQQSSHVSNPPLSALFSRGGVCRLRRPGESLCTAAFCITTFSRRQHRRAVTERDNERRLAAARARTRDLVQLLISVTARGPSPSGLHPDSVEASASVAGSRGGEHL